MDMELVRRECLRGAYHKLAPSVQPPVTCRQHSIEEYSDLLAEWRLKRPFSLEDPQTSGNSGHPAGCQKWQAWQHRGFCLSLAGRAKFCQAAKWFQRASRRIQLFHIHSPCSRHHGFDFNFGQLSSSARYSPAFLCCHSPVMNRINLPLVRTFQTGHRGYLVHLPLAQLVAVIFGWSRDGSKFDRNGLNGHAYINLRSMLSFILLSMIFCDQFWAPTHRALAALTAPSELLETLQVLLGAWTGRVALGSFALGSFQRDTKTCWLLKNDKNELDSSRDHICGILWCVRFMDLKVSGVQHPLTIPVYSESLSQKVLHIFHSVGFGFRGCICVDLHLCQPGEQQSSAKRLVNKGSARRGPWWGIHPTSKPTELECGKAPSGFKSLDHLDIPTPIEGEGGGTKPTCRIPFFLRKPWDSDLTPQMEL